MSMLKIPEKQYKSAKLITAYTTGMAFQRLIHGPELTGRKHLLKPSSESLSGVGVGEIEVLNQ